MSKTHSRLLLLAVFLPLLAVASGCPDEPAGDDDDSGDGDGDGGDGDGDGDGDGGGGPISVGCSADEQCPSGTVCELVSGACIAGFDCTGNPTICAFCSDPGDTCGTGAAPAYCDDDAGVCRRTRGACEPCGSGEECGIGQQGYANICEGGYCLEGCATTCASGFACSGGGCAPVAAPGSCSQATLCADGTGCPDGTSCTEYGVCLSICAGDLDCAAGTICQLDPGPTQGTCIQGCDEGTVVNSGGVDLICHATGRYGAFCPGTTCVPGTECEADGHCGLSGCLDSTDCPLPSTYCDTGTAECVPGCSVDDDCVAFETCEEGECKQGGCRGKDVSCNLGQWCCGEELYDDPSSCPSEVEEGLCFYAQDPYCRTCEDNDGCADIDLFGQPSYCYELQQEDENGEAESIGKFCSVGCTSNLDCPRGIPCTELPTETEGVTIMGCIAALCAPLSEGPPGQ